MLLTVLGLASAVLLGALRPSISKASAGLSAELASDAYSLATVCDYAKPVAFVRVLVRNSGGAAAAPGVLRLIDASGALHGEAEVVSIAPRSERVVQIALQHDPANVSPVSGSHVLNVVAGTQRLAPLSISIPPGFCAARSAVVAPHAPATLATLPPPDVPVRVQPAPDAPLGLEVADFADCADSGIVAVAGGTAYNCREMLNDGKVVVHWRPADCASNCKIAGYRVYEYHGTTVIADVPEGRYAALLLNARLGACYVVRAHRAQKESRDSTARCVTVLHTTQRLTLGPSELSQFRAVVHDNTDHGYCTRHSWDDVWAHEGWGFVVKTNTLKADPQAPPASQLTIGWLGQVHNGTRPFPCQEALLQVWRGALVFAVPSEARQTSAKIVFAFTAAGSQAASLQCFHYLWPPQQWYYHSDNNGSLLGVSDGHVLDHGNAPLGLISFSNDRASFDLSGVPEVRNSGRIVLELSAFDDGLNSNDIAHPTLHEGRYARLDGSNACGARNAHLEIAYPRTQSTTAPLILQTQDQLERNRTAPILRNPNVGEVRATPEVR